MTENGQKLINSLIKHPLVGALLVWILLNLSRFLILLFFDRNYFLELFKFLEDSFSIAILTQLPDIIVPYIFLFFSKKVFTVTSENLSIKINEGMKQVKETQNVSVMGFTRIAEARDPDTGEHILRIAHYSRCIAEQLAKTEKYKDYITPNYIEEIYISAPLHDIGKVGIKDEILLKEGKLTDSEFEIMKMHTIIGGNVVAELERKLQFRTFFTLGKEIAYHHHQKYNGKGYPNIFKEDIMLVEEGVGKPLVGNQIPLSARIVALADVYDALVSKRCYKRSLSHEAACDIIAAERGEHFDPDVVDAFTELNSHFKEILSKFR